MYNVSALWPLSSTCNMRDANVCTFSLWGCALYTQATSCFFRHHNGDVSFGHNNPQRSTGRNEQGSEPVHSEVHSQRGRGPQSPDPPASPYFLQAGVTLLYLVDHHDRHVCLGVCHAVKMLCHRRIFSPLMRNVKTMVVGPTV